ncbi:MAG: histidine kinase [Bacteroidales bacterium]
MRTGSPDIILNTYSAGNFSDSSSSHLSDYYSWLIVLNEKLDFMFLPMKFNSTFSKINVFSNTENSKTNLIAMLVTKEEGEMSNMLFKIENNGKILIEKKVQKGDHQLIRDEKRNMFFLFNRFTGEIKYLNSNLTFGKMMTTFPNSILESFDVDYDGERERLFFHKNNNKVILTRNDFSHPVEINFIGDAAKSIKFSKVKTGKSKSMLFFQKGEYWYKYTYYKNPFYVSRFLIYFGLFLSLLGLIYLIRKGQKIQLEKKVKIENLISELQIKTIKNQVDPHFVFNSINTISEMMLSDDKIEADKFICNFSDLMRKTLQSSDKIIHTLKEEVDYIESYIQLQKLRYNNSFDYQINIDQNINMLTTVPKHVLFSYVENAIKHGLSRKKEKGILKIIAKKKINNLVLIVEDNGIGLEKSKTIKSHSTGHGLQIMEKIYNLYSKIYKNKITHELSEILDKNKNCKGVKVEIIIST